MYKTRDIFYKLDSTFSIIIIFYSESDSTQCKGASQYITFCRVYASKQLAYPALHSCDAILHSSR